MGDVVADFCAITGEPEDSAINYLTAADFNLETAAQLFFAAHGGAQTDRPPQAPPPRQQQAPPTGGASHQHVSRLFDDEGHARGANEGGDDFAHFMGQNMQAMEAAMQMQLPGGGFPEMFGGRGGRAGNRGRAPRVSPRVEVLPSDDDDVDEQRASQSAESDGSEVRPPRRDIATLFRAPRYAYQGGFQECCQNAVAKERLVILNILRRGDFRSGCLNRDIWADTLVKDIVPQMCNVFQVLHDTDEGQLLTSTYQLSSGSIPCLLIVNPLTRAVIHEMNVARLIQANGVWNVTTFLDNLTTLVSQNAAVFTRVITDDEDPSRQSSVEQLSPHGGRARHGDGDDEDAQLARALAESERMALEEDVVHAVSGRALKQSKVEKLPTTSGGSEAVPATAVASGGAASLVPPPSSPPPAPVAAAPVDISQYQNPQGNDRYHLRFRVPSGSLEVDVSGRIPVARLVAYVAFHIHSTNQAAYPVPPQIELRGGFPPKPLAFPDGDATLTLADWGMLRQNDNVLVHLP